MVYHIWQRSENDGHVSVTCRQSCETGAVQTLSAGPAGELKGVAGQSWSLPAIWVCLKMVSTPKANGFADHYPYEKWL